MFFLQIIPGKWQKNRHFRKDLWMGVWFFLFVCFIGSTKCSCSFYKRLSNGGGEGGEGGVMIIWQSAFKLAPLKNILVHFLRTENWLVECTSNTLLSCPTALSTNNTQIKYKYPAILYSDLNSWCFSIVDYAYIICFSWGRKLMTFTMNAQK